MKRYLIILTTLTLAASCGNDRDTTRHNNEHNAPANNTSSAATADQKLTEHSGSDHSSMKSSPGAAAAPYDLQFLDTMIAHHKGAVEMAMLADTRASRAELKDLASSIIYDQEREIAKMSEWRERWFEGKPEAINMEFPGMSHGMGGIDPKKLESLKGTDFDIEFIRQMIPHHEGAVQMAKALKANDAHAELKELADDIIAAQETEIKQMREWLSTWQSH